MQITYIGLGTLIWQIYWFVIIPFIGFMFGMMVLSVNPYAPYERRFEPDKLSAILFFIAAISVIDAVLGDGMWWTAVLLLLGTRVGYLGGIARERRLSELDSLRKSRQEG